MASPMSKFWCFTLNNPDLENTPVFDQERVAYAVYQVERGEQGTLHLQGYVELTQNMRMVGVKNLFGGWAQRAHWEKRRATRDAAREYCMKEETRVQGPFEFGVWQSRSQGKRSDLANVVELIKQGKTMKELLEEYPEVTVRNMRSLQAVCDLYAKPPQMDDFAPSEWQQRLLDVFAAPVHKRRVYWVYDRVGGKGKSYFAQFLIRNHGAMLLSGRVQDMAYAVAKRADAGPLSICVFDIARAQADNLRHLYHFAEEIKNGAFFCAKYESKLVVIPSPHVVFFANVMPDAEAWSADRVEVIDLEAYPVYA